VAEGVVADGVSVGDFGTRSTSSAGGGRQHADRTNHSVVAGPPGALANSTGLGAASSSCSYAAVALARSLVRKGANFTAAMAFEIGSTNLVSN